MTLPSRPCRPLAATVRWLPILTLTLPAVALAEAHPALHLPWREAGLTERQAAAHLLDRFAYGPRPGEVDRVVAMGLEAWLEEQLAAPPPGPEVERRLAGLPSLAMTTEELVRTYPGPGILLAQARRAGVLPERSPSGTMETTEGTDRAAADRRQMRSRMAEWARSRGYRPQRESLEELTAQKLYRAVYAEGQLVEVLTDFWLNHFNVSSTEPDTRALLTAYERDAIRPHVLGRFGDLLRATAQHPAMLLYLDNARSVAEEGAPTTLDSRLGTRWRRGGRGLNAGRLSGRGTGVVRDGQTDEVRQRVAERRPRGLNENYGRELLELHTLGVDGGYDQQDVVEVARAFTGWTVLPPWALDDRRTQQRLARARAMPDSPFVVDGSFLFRADAHDAGEKNVLGRRLPPGRGIEDGLEVLDLLAGHPATAHHLATELAVRFVSDEPPPALVDRLAASYLESGGDLAAVVRSLAQSPELWSPAAVGSKVKSPFELVVSALRAVGAEVRDARAAVAAVGRMGEPLYACPAPTGFPERGSAWVNAGALLERMSFGLELAGGSIAGVRVDLAAVSGAPPPQSQEEALASYLASFLPGRDLDDALATLGPALDADRPPAPAAGRAPFAAVAGLVLGSPEFQRR